MNCSCNYRLSRRNMTIIFLTHVEENRPIYGNFVHAAAVVLSSYFCELVYVCMNVYTVHACIHTYITYYVF